MPDRGGLATYWQVGKSGPPFFTLMPNALLTLSFRCGGGIPILFPICGNLPNNQYDLNGQTYTLKQHGFARDLPWQVVEQGDKRCRQPSPWNSTVAKQPAARYPFDFKLRFTFQLHGPHS